jgi:predicted DCC family thiol-disulfide oxidoreductase YuxK
MPISDNFFETYPRIVLFDGVCNFCDTNVQRIMRNDADGNFVFASLQSSIGQQLLIHFQLDQQALDSIVLIEGNKAFTMSSAILRIVRKMNWPWKILYAGILLPRFLRDHLYNWVAKNRYRWYGKKDQCMIPTPEQRRRFIE